MNARCRGRGRADQRLTVRRWASFRCVRVSVCLFSRNGRHVLAVTCSLGVAKRNIKGFVLITRGYFIIFTSFKEHDVVARA